MNTFLQIFLDNLPKVLTGAATAVLTAIITYLYKRGSWTREHRKAALFEEKGDKLLANGMALAAIEQYKYAVKIWEEEVNRGRMLAIFHKIGRAYHKLGDTEQALEALTHCELLWEMLKKQVKIFDIYYELADLYRLKGNLERAAHYVGLAIDTLRAQQSPRLPIVLALAALIAKERGRPDEAEERYLEAVQVMEAIGDTLGLASVYYELGDLKSAQEQLMGARRYYERSRVEFEKLGSARASEIKEKLLAEVE